MVIARTVVPPPENGTGHPWALTEYVLRDAEVVVGLHHGRREATASSSSITVDQRTPAPT
jgi:hypothetical protein